MQTSIGRQPGQGPSAYLFCTLLALSSLTLAVNAGSTITVGENATYSTIQVLHAHSIEARLIVVKMIGL